jgi:hypothetical protein
MRPFTLVLPYYENAGMLEEQQRVWNAYAPDIQAALHIIVVDDGSPAHPAEPHVRETWVSPGGARFPDLDEVPTAPWTRVGPASFRLYRTLVDVRWNWLFCRNLGVDQATTDWVLLTDIDHVVPEATWRALMTEDLDELSVYRFSRVDAPDLTPYKPHPNSWCLTRALFDRIGGYDERFSGYYGTDSEFRERVHHQARAVILREDALIRYPREVIADASTTTYGRKEERDRAAVARIRAERERQKRWRTKRLTFPFERVV